MVKVWLTKVLRATKYQIKFVACDDPFQLAFMLQKFDEKTWIIDWNNEKQHHHLSFMAW